MPQQPTTAISNSKPSNTCWIHLQDIKFFLHLGVNAQEKIIGQNITLNLSLKINFEDTKDKVENTVDYGKVIEHIKNHILGLKEINLLEYLCEQILNSIGSQFTKIQAAKICIQKGYVPIQNYTGTVKIEAEKTYFNNLSNK